VRGRITGFFRQPNHWLLGPSPWPSPLEYTRSFIYAITPLFPHFCTSLRISPVGSALRTTTRFRGTTECEEMVRSADPTQLLFMREVTALMKYLAAYRRRGKKPNAIALLDGAWAESFCGLIVKSRYYGNLAANEGCAVSNRSANLVMSRRLPPNAKLADGRHVKRVRFRPCCDWAPMPRDGIQILVISTVFFQI
jgi:hypothetical protein